MEGNTNHHSTVAGDAADHLAALHRHHGPAFGFEREMVVGPVRQPNPCTKTWADFYRDVLDNTLVRLEY